MSSLILPIQIRGRGYLNTKEYDTNAVTSVHGSIFTVERLIEEIENDNEEKISLYYLNNKKATEILATSRNPIPTTMQNLDGLIHRITDEGSPVKSIIPM